MTSFIPVVCIKDPKIPIVIKNIPLEEKKELKYLCKSCKTKQPSPLFISKTGIQFKTCNVCRERKRLHRERNRNEKKTTATKKSEVIDLYIEQSVLMLQALKAL